MVKVKVFGVLRTTIGMSYIEVNASTVQGVFEEISKVMKKNYVEYHLRKEKEKEDPKLKYKPPRNEALMPHEDLQFKDAIVYVSGERCMKKKMKLQGDEEIWLLSPAAGG